MKQSIDVEEYKRQLNYYLHNKRKLKELESKLKDLEYKLTGVSGVDPSKIPSSPNNNNDYLYMLYERKDSLEEKIERLKNKIDEIEETFELIDSDNAKLIYEVFVKHKTIEQVANNVYLSTNALANRMTRAIQIAINTKND